MSDLAYQRTNVYKVADEKLMKEIFDYAEGYKTFIDEGKTEIDGEVQQTQTLNCKVVTGKLQVYYSQGETK